MNCNDIICVLAMFDLWLISSRTSAYYTKNYGDYNLTIRDNAGNQLMTQSGARDWCRTNLNGSPLASVSNGDLQANMEQFANDAVSVKYLSENNIILNAQLEGIYWKWLNGQYLTNADIQGQTRPETNYLLYACLLTGNYNLKASKPTDKRSYLCQYSGDTSNCGDNRFQFHERCYRKYDTPKVSWFDARNNCQREGGELASFDYLTRDTLSTLNSSALYPATSTDYWVGLRTIKWNWFDSGSEVNLTYWVDGHPSDYIKQCICLGPRNLYNWKWIECDCNQNHQFICFTVLNQATRTPSGLSSPISPLNPTSISSTSLKPLALSSSLASGSSASAATTNDSYMPSLKSSDISTTPANSSESHQQQKSDQVLAVGLGVGLGVGVPLIVLLIVIVALLVKKRKRNLKRDVSKVVFGRTSKNNSATTNDHSLNDVALKKPGDDVGNPALGGTTLATDGEVANPYEVLQSDARNNERLYQELSNYETIQTDS